MGVRGQEPARTRTIPQAERAGRPAGAAWADLRRALATAPTRREVLRGAGALGIGAAAAAGGWRVARPVAAAQATPEAEPAQATPATEPGARAPEVQTILDAAATLEAAEVTLVGVARQRAAQGVLDLGEGATVVRYLRAAQCQEEAHYYYFVDAEGGVPATLTFSFAESIFRSRSSFLRTLLELEELEIGLYMMAARAFAGLGELRLVEVAYQLGAVEGQHYAILKGFLNEFPANDRAFARWRFPDVATAAEAIAATGFLEETEPRYEFPGPIERFCRGVFGLVPETTETET